MHLLLFSVGKGCFLHGEVEGEGLSLNPVGERQGKRKEGGQGCDSSTLYLGRRRLSFKRLGSKWYLTVLKWQGTLLLPVMGISTANLSFSSSFINRDYPDDPQGNPPSSLPIGCRTPQSLLGAYIFQTL